MRTNDATGTARIRKVTIRASLLSARIKQLNIRPLATDAALKKINCVDADLFLESAC
jgi:hypothetical protein